MVYFFTGDIPGQSFSSKIVDRQTGIPVSDAAIKVFNSNQTARSDNPGMFTLTGLPAKTKKVF